MPVLIDIITKGSTDQSLTLRMADSTDGTPETGVTSATTGVDVWYRRQGGAKVSLTESDLSALTDAHSDGGLLHISDGEYRVDFPDAAFASGADWVDVGWGATGMVGFGGRVRLIAANLEDATRLGLTALPNAAADAAGGLPISDAGGLDLDTLNSNVSAVLADTGTDGVVVAAASKTGYSLTATTGLGNQTADITGSLSGSVGSVTGAVGSVTGNVGGNVVGSVASVTGAVGSVTGNVGGNVTGSVGSVTGGINTGAGVITTLDGLDTAQDTQHSTTQGLVTTVDTVVDTILVDTNELQTDWTNGGRLDLLVDAIKAVTDALTSAAAAKLATSAGTIITGTVSNAVLTPTTTAFAADDITEATADHYNGRIIIFTSGALVGQATDITDYSLVSSEGNFTVTALTESPANDDTFVII